MEEAKENKPLSKRHRAFIEEYLRDFNATQAYLRVYPSSTYEAAAVSASKLLKNPNIQKEIRDRIDAIAMTADEALKRLSEMARGDVARIMDVSSVGFNLDMRRAQEEGLTHLIKKVKQKTTTYIAKKESEEDREITELEVELYDAQAALRDILKMHGKFTERVDVTSGGEKLETKVDDAKFDRAISSLADAIKSIIVSENKTPATDESSGE